MNQRLDRRPAMALGVAVCAAVPVLARGDSPGLEGVFVPDVERFRGDRDVEIPWTALSATGLVLVFVVVASAVIFLAGRATERRRRRPPRSILKDGRRTRRTPSAISPPSPSSGSRRSPPGSPAS